MKTGTLVLLGVGGYLLWDITQNAIAVNTVNIVLQGVQVNSITDYVVTLTVQNVSNISATVNSMTGNILINGNQLASISNFTATTVPANGQINIPVTVQPSLLSLPGDIANIIQNGMNTLNFTVVGNVNVNGLVLPFTLTQAVNF